MTEEYNMKVIEKIGKGCKSGGVILSKEECKETLKLFMKMSEAVTSAGKIMTNILITELDSL